MKKDNRPITDEEIVPVSENPEELYDYEAAIGKEKKKVTVGRIINICLTVALFTFIILFIVRVCHADYKGLEAPKINTSNFKEAFKLCESEEDIRTHNIAGVNDEGSSEDGSIRAYSLIYIEKAGYVQFTVKLAYGANKKEITTTINDNEKLLYGEEASEYSYDSTDFLFYLKDSKGKVYKPEILEKDGKSDTYSYFKLEYTNVDFTADDITLHLVIKNVDETELEIDGEKKSTLIYKEGNEYYVKTGSVVIHEKDQKSIPYELTDDDKEALGIKEEK